MLICRHMHLRLWNQHEQLDIVYKLLLQILLTIVLRQLQEKIDIDFFLLAFIYLF